MNGPPASSAVEHPSPEAPDEEAPRFAFGRNWARFLTTLDEQRIVAAEASLRALLGAGDLTGQRFLDAGSGSGLFSLAAYRQRAVVTSFDFDGDSVACTRELRRRFADQDAAWQVFQGSLLDASFMARLGRFQVVYCWGVAHHTGQMWVALQHLVDAVDEGGRLVVAIYNDQGYISRGWTTVKRTYQKLPRFLRPVWVAVIGGVEFALRAAATLAACLLRLVTFRNPWTPLGNWLAEKRSRGMHGWHDLVDWVGGWPFEVAKPEAIFRFARDRGFELEELRTVQGHGCNEFVFRKSSGGPLRGPRPKTENAGEGFS